MRIAEIYKSVQGEGLLTGTESVFVRASGCNLRCHYCDTPFASWNPEGADQSVDEIARTVNALKCSHVVLTGGEPMLFAELIPLCERLQSAGKHLTIETAGTLYLPVVCDLMSISPKTANSAPDPIEYPKWHDRHEKTRHAPEVIRKLVDDYAYQFKFVIESPEDLEEVEAYLTEFGDAIRRDRVMLMPEGTTTSRLAEIEKWLKPLCSKMGVQFCPRKQIEWYGMSRGT
ncbi:MAG: 7-carboxy-7-deazaguanine synthase QueE [Planctomycetota bacterium]